MTPTIDERLASVVRALTEVILPHLPAEASLAQEQTQLAIGHLQIIRAQLDAAPAFEREELDDAIGLAKALVDQVDGGTATKQAIGELAEALAAADGSNVRVQHQAINDAIDTVVKGAATDGTDASKNALFGTILEREKVRIQKDRVWFAPFGFDTP